MADVKHTSRQIAGHIGRPMQFDPDAALAQATELFWDRGYEATSLSDLLEATGLSKSSLYQTFESKHLLFERCMQSYRRQLVADLRERLDCSECALDFLAGLLVEAAEQARRGQRPRGCFLMNTASEFAQRDPVIAAEVRKGIDALHEVFADAVRRGQQSGRIAADLDANTTASYLMSTGAGLKTMAKAGVGAKEIRAAAQFAMRALA